MTHKCEGDEPHEHFSIATGTYVEHQHAHDICHDNFNNLHHHPPVDHHVCTSDELVNGEKDTGRGLVV